jgi:hypothetical protein
MLSKRKRKSVKKLVLSRQKSRLYVIGLVAKEPKAKRKAGLIAMLLMVRVDISPVDALPAKKERNTLHVGLHPALAKSEVKVSLGVKKDLKEKGKMKTCI